MQLRDAERAPSLLHPCPPLGLWSKLLESTDLDEASKEIACARVALRARDLRQRVHRLLWAYRVSKITVTAGALLVPSITGLDESKAQPVATFWLIWGISLATAAGNALISLFGIDRKYFLLKERSSRLEEEAWLFLTRAGRYRSSLTHQEQFPAFMEHCEALLTSAHHQKSKLPPQPSPQAPGPLKQGPFDKADASDAASSPRLLVD